MTDRARATTTARAEPPATAPRIRSAGRQRLVTWITIAGVIALGTAASIFAVAVQRDQARTIDGRAATTAAMAIQDSLNQSAAALRGGDALVTSGEVDPDDFAAFAADVVPATEFTSVAREVIVPGRERDEFEASTGTAIVDMDGEGGLVPAEDRDEYVVVVQVEPDTAQPATVVGFDVTSDPTRDDARRRAAASGTAAWSGRISLASTGEDGYFVISPLQISSGEVVGFVSSALPINTVLDSATDRVPTGTALALDDGSGTVGDSLAGGERARVDVGDLTFTVVADDPDRANYVLAGLIAATTILFTLALIAVALRDARTGRTNLALSNRLRVKNARNVALADMARELSGIDQLDDVFESITAHAAGVLKADHADVGLLEDGRLVMTNRDTPFDAEIAERYRSVPVALHLPTTEAALSADLVVVEDLARYQSDHPELLADVIASGARSAVAVPLVATNRTVMGVLSIMWMTPIHFDDPLLFTTRTLGELCTQTIERAILAGRNAARAVQSHAIAEMGQRLGALSQQDDIVRLVADTARDIVRAASANVALLDAERSGLRVVHDDTLATDLADLADRYSFQPLDASLPLVTAAATGTEVLLPSPDDVAAQYPHVMDDLAAAGFEAIACVPVTDDAGRPMGALGFAFDTANAFDDVDIDSMRTIAALVAPNLERAAAAERRTRQAEAMQALAEGLAAAITRPQIGECVARLVPAVVDASVAAVAFHDAAVDSLEEMALDATGVQTMDAPIQTAEGLRLGVLSMAWSTPITVDASLRAVVATITDLIGATADRAALHEVEHGLVVALQNRLIGPLPKMPGVEMAARYNPASDVVGIGGDWYEAIGLDDGSVVVTVGDVTGHGVDAVASMAELQSLITGLVRAGTPLGGVFSLASSMLDTGGPSCATAQLLHIDVVHGRLGYLNAGHPWALVRRPDGSVVRLDQAVHEPLGMPITPRPLTYLDLEPGSLVLAYTDGLVERRRRMITDGIDLLAAHLSALDPERPIDDLLEELVAEARRPSDDTQPEDDDVAAILLRIAPEPTDLPGIANGGDPIVAAAGRRRAEA